VESLAGPVESLEPDLGLSTSVARSPNSEEPGPARLGTSLVAPISCASIDGRIDGGVLIVDPYLSSVNFQFIDNFRCVDKVLDIPSLSLIEGGFGTFFPVWTG